jgi:hypothetical protein
VTFLEEVKEGITQVFTLLELKIIHIILELHSLTTTHNLFLRWTSSSKLRWTNNLMDGEMVKQRIYQLANNSLGKVEQMVGG